jgi:hypothetical protein
MEKIKLIGKAVEMVKFSFNNQDIQVIPFISSKLQESLISVYFSAYFAGLSESRLDAERVNKMAVLDLMTNIDINLPIEDLTNMLDEIVSSGLWGKIEASIFNYPEYKKNLSVAVESKKKENSDIGFIVKTFIDEKITPLLEKFSTMDFTDEKLAEIKGVVSEIGKQLDPNTPVGSLIKEGEGYVSKEEKPKSVTKVKKEIKTRKRK